MSNYPLWYELLIGLIHFFQNRMYYYPSIDVSACTEVSRKIAFTIFGDENIGVAFLKVFFTILCEAKLKDKLGYLFKDFSNSKYQFLTWWSVPVLEFLIHGFKNWFCPVQCTLVEEVPLKSDPFLHNFWCYKLKIFSVAGS